MAGTHPDIPRNPVVVGIDGSSHSRGALRWAADEAAARGLPLRVLHAAGSAEPELWAAARAMTADAVAEARAWHQDLAVTGEVIDGQPFTELCAASRAAELVVVANRGLGGFAELLLGSVSAQVALHASGAVAVVHGAERLVDQTEPTRTDLPVLVGADSSAESDKAIGVAFEEAEARGAPLVAIRAWQPPLVAYRGEIRQSRVNRAAIERTASWVVNEAVAGWRAKHPSVPVETRMVTESPAAALVAASRDAQMLVVGSRGHGDYPGLRLGATTHQLLHHAGCPVMVVRGPLTAEE